MSSQWINTGARMFESAHFLNSNSFMDYENPKTFADRMSPVSMAIRANARMKVSDTAAMEDFGLDRQVNSAPMPKNLNEDFHAASK